MKRKLSPDELKHGVCLDTDHAPSPQAPTVVCVPVEPTPEMIDAWEHLGLERLRRSMDGIESITPYRSSIKETWATVIVAAPPSSHVPVPRELLERVIDFIAPSSSGHSDDVVRELRSLLTTRAGG